MEEKKGRQLFYVISSASFQFGRDTNGPEFFLCDVLASRDVYLRCFSMVRCK
jgi:hypothetical protein